MKIKSLKNFKLIRIAYSEQYLSKKYPSISEYHSLILSFVNEFKKLPKKESKVKIKRFFDSLEKLSDVSEDSLSELYNQISALEFENKESKFHPLIINSLSKLEEREWVQSLLDNKIELEEDLPQIVHHIKEFNDLGGEGSLNDFKSDSELFQYLSQFKKTVELEYPDELKELLPRWKIDEDVVEGHKVELYLLEREKIDHRDSLQIIGADTNWCVTFYPNPVTEYSPDEFHCFFIDNKPEVLIHLNSGQIKDVNNAPLTSYLIKYINPLIEKHNLRLHLTDEEIDDEYEDDFEFYDSALETIQSLKSRLDDKEYIKSQVEEDVSVLKYLPLDETWKYMDVLYSDAQDSHSSTFNDLSFDVLNNFGNYIKTNNLEIPIKLKSHILHILQYRSNLYLKTIPTSIRKLFPEFNEGFEILRSKKTKGNDGLYKTDLYHEFLKVNPGKWLKSFPESEELKNHPKILDSLTEGYISGNSSFNITSNNWSSIPKEVIDSPKFSEVKRDMVANFIAQFTNYNSSFIPYSLLRVRVWKSIPTTLRSDPALLPYRSQVLEVCKNGHISWVSVPEDLRDDPELAELKADEKNQHLHLLKSRLSFDDIPKEFFEDSEFKQSVLNLCVDHLERYPTSYKKLPRFLVNEETLMATRKGYLSHLRKKPEDYYHLPDTIVSDPEILLALREGWLHSLRNNYSGVSRIPVHLRDDPEIQKARIEGRVKLLSSNCWNWVHMKDSLKEEPEIKACIPSVINDFISSIERDESLLNRNALPVDLLSSVELYNTIKRAYSKLIKKDPYFWNSVHEEFEKDPDLLRDYLNGFIRLLSSDPCAPIPKELKDSEELQLARIEGHKKQLRKDPRNMHYVQDHLRNTPEIYDAAVDGHINVLNRDLSNWSSIPVKYKKDPRIKSYYDSVVNYFLNKLKEEPNHFLPDDVILDPRIKSLIPNRTSFSGFKLIKV